MDIFYEPYEGVIMHGGSELGTGIAKVKVLRSLLKPFPDRWLGCCQLLEENDVWSGRYGDKSH